MLDNLRDAVVASVRLRASQGDCPTEPAHTVETLENVILALPQQGETTPVRGDEVERIARIIAAEVVRHNGFHPLTDYDAMKASGFALPERVATSFFSHDEIDALPIARKVLAALHPTDQEAIRREALEETARGEPYLVWSNEHRAWWAPDERGYTRHVERAGRYDRAKAMEIASTRGGGWPAEVNPYEIAIPERDAIEQATARALMSAPEHRNG